jgi:hypothetical protein
MDTLPDVVLVCLGKSTGSDCAVINLNCYIANLNSCNVCSLGKKNKGFKYELTGKSIKLLCNCCVTGKL